MMRTLARGLVACVVVLAAVLAVGSSPSRALQRFPSVTEVDAALPGLAGGSRYVDAGEPVQVFALDEAAGPRYCTTHPVDSGRSRSARYGDSEKYLDFYPLTLTRYQLDSVAAAKQLLAQVRAGVAACAGETTQADGVSVLLHPVKLPRVLGKDRFAYAVAGGYDEGVTALSRQGSRVFAVHVNAYRTRAADVRVAEHAMRLLLVRDLATRLR